MGFAALDGHEWSTEPPLAEFRFGAHGPQCRAVYCCFACAQARPNEQGYREAAMKTLICAAAALAMILVEPSAQARVSRIEITSTQTYGSFRAGEYARWDGRIVGELAPTDGTIPDLEKATRDANGKVQ